jgi:hypothetical protein
VQAHCSGYGVVCRPRPRVAGTVASSEQSTGSAARPRASGRGSRGRAGRFRLLVIAPAEVDGAALREEIEHEHGGGQAQVHLIAPAVTGSPIKHAMGDVDEGAERARERLEPAMRDLKQSRMRVSGGVGDADPMIAAEDALAIFPADEVLLVTHRDGDTEWFEDGLFDRASERLRPPVSHAVVAGSPDEGVREVERSGSGASERELAENEVGLSPNLPPFERTDLAGIVVALVGTVLLAILAADAGDHSNTAFAASRILIAIAFALINLAHVVGLLFFDSVGYRGPAQTLFRTLSLIGTPIAVAVSLLLGLVF